MEEEEESFNYGGHEAACVAATDSSLCVMVGIDDQRQRVWVPRKHVHEDSEVTAIDEEGVFAVNASWAEKQGHAGDIW